jgi:hypothetical protein
MVSMPITTTEATIATNTMMVEEEEADHHITGMEMIGGEVHHPSGTTEMEIIVASALEVAVHPTVELRLEGVDAVVHEEVEAKVRPATNHIALEEIATLVIETIDVKVRRALDGGIEMTCEAAVDRS